MPTTNVDVTEAWTLVMSSAATSGTVAVVSGGVAEFATTADNSTAPTVNGYPLSIGMGITREMPGFETGSIWARAMPLITGGTAASKIAVNA